MQEIDEKQVRNRKKKKEKTKEEVRKKIGANTFYKLIFTLYNP